jgi:drug/metabolite transporter (DMT)-like permease
MTDPSRSDAGARPADVARATALVLFSACCFGSIPILITIAIRSGATLVDVLAWRYVIAAVLLVAVGGGLARVRRSGRIVTPLLLLAGGGQAAIAFVSLSALRYIPAATLSFLFYTYPAWVAVIAAARGAERIGGRRAMALALSLAGITLMVGMPGTGHLNPAGVLLALSSAIMYAAYIPMIDHLGRDLPPAVTSVYASGGAALILVVVALSQGGPAFRFAPSAWGAIATLAVVSTVLAFLAFLRGLAVIGPVRTAIVSTVEPFWTALLGSLVLAQRLGPRTLAGGVCIAAAVILLQVRSHTSTPAPSAC